MRAGHGQALVELALCAPVVMILAVGAAAVVQVEDAAAGLDAATHAAAIAASRAPDPATATKAAQARFAAVVTGYPLSGTTLAIDLSGFQRDGHLTVSSTAFVDVAWAALVLPHHVEVRSRAVMRIEPWRTHRTAA
jgi:Flp pilus assembly protein TadG